MYAASAVVRSGCCRDSCCVRRTACTTALARSQYNRYLALYSDIHASVYANSYVSILIGRRLLSIKCVHIMLFYASILTTERSR
jgi:hypothetical protein